MSLGNAYGCCGTRAGHSRLQNAFCCPRSCSAGVSDERRTLVRDRLCPRWLAMGAPAMREAADSASAQGGTVMGAPRMILKYAGCLVAGALPAVLAGRSMLALGALVFLAVLLFRLIRWIISSNDRSERLARIILAWRGDVSCLAPPASVQPRSRRLAWRRRG